MAHQKNASKPAQPDAAVPDSKSFGLHSLSKFSCKQFLDRNANESGSGTIAQTKKTPNALIGFLIQPKTNDLLRHLVCSHQHGFLDFKIFLSENP
jgi:hypothetical protein